MFTIWSEDLTLSIAIDAHTHVGTCRVFDSNVTPEALLESMNRYHVEASVVQPFPGAPDPSAVHTLIADLAKRFPGRIHGMASLNPHQDHEAYKAEVERCVRELGFVAVKAHVLGHALNPKSRDARLVFETAAAHDIPVMVHTGHGIPFADPAMWMGLAREFSATTVIFGHAGAPMFTGAAIAAAEVTPNIVLETSWCSPQDIGRAIRAIGADRIMFGSDLGFNPGVEAAKYESLGLTDSDLGMCLGGTAARVYGVAAAVAK